MIDIMEQNVPDSHCVIEEISPNDNMFSGNKEHYFSVGKSALLCIRNALSKSPKKNIRSILDFPCGYGRVLRTLKTAFPDARLTACDLDREGVDFCTRTFGSTPIYSKEDPSLIELSGPFDLIWSGSLFTHLDSCRWQGFLDLFKGSLSRTGVLIFTVHGQEAINRLKKDVSTYGLDCESIVQLLDQYKAS